jgi:hypothetical protein
VDNGWGVGEQWQSSNGCEHDGVAAGKREEKQPATFNKQRSMGNDALTSRMTCLLDGNAETRVGSALSTVTRCSPKSQSYKARHCPAGRQPHHTTCSSTPPLFSSLHFTLLYTPHTTPPNPIQSTLQPPTWVASSLSEATSRCTLPLAAVKRRTANPPPGTELLVPQRRLSTTSTTPSSTPTSVCALGPSCLRSVPV